MAHEFGPDANSERSPVRISACYLRVCPMTRQGCPGQAAALGGRPGALVRSRSIKVASPDAERRAPAHPIRPPRWLVGHGLVYTALARWIINRYGDDASIDQTKCLKQGDSACEIRIRWVA